MSVRAPKVEEWPIEDSRIVRVSVDAPDLTIGVGNSVAKLDRKAALVLIEQLRGLFENWRPRHDV